MLSIESEVFSSHAEAQIEILLQELADPKRCTSGVEDKLLQLFSFEGAPPHKIVKLAQNLGSFGQIFKTLPNSRKSKLALKVIKIATEALTRQDIQKRSFISSKVNLELVNGQGIENDSVNECKSSSIPEEARVDEHDLWIRTLARCGLLSLEFIDNLCDLLNIAELDKEKAACNIATKLVDLDHPHLSLSFVEYVYNKLWSDKKQDLSTDEDDQKRRTQHLQNNLKTSFETLNHRSTTISTNSRAIGLMSLPKKAMSEFNNERIIIGIVCISVVLKVVLSDLQFRDTKILSQAVKYPHLGIEALFKKLTNSGDLKACEKYSGYMFKILHLASIKHSKNVSIALFLRSLSLEFFCQSSLYTFALYQDIVRYTAKIYKNAIPDSSEVSYPQPCIKNTSSTCTVYPREPPYQSDIANFYNGVLDHISQGISTSLTELDCKWMKNCFEVCMETCNMDNLKTRASQVLTAFFSSPFQIESLISTPIRAILAALKNVDILLCLIYSKDRDINDIQEETMCSLRLLYEIITIFTPGSGHDDIKLLLRSLRFQREIALELFRDKSMDITGLNTLDMVLNLLRKILEGNEGTSDLNLSSIEILSYAYDVSETCDNNQLAFDITNSICLVARCICKLELSIEIIGVLEKLNLSLEKKLSGVVTPDNIITTGKLIDVYVWYLIKSKKYKKAHECIIKGVLLLMKKEFDYKRSQCLMRLLKKLVERFVRIQNPDESVFLVDLIKTANRDLSIEDAFVIGEMEIYYLKILPRYAFNSLVSIARLGDELLSFIGKEDAPITYTRDVDDLTSLMKKQRMLMEKAFALRCLSPEKCANIRSKTPNNPVWCCDETLSTFERMEKKELSDRNDVVSEVMGYDRSCIIAEAHFLKGITQNERGDYNGTPFFSALSSWTEKLQSANHDNYIAKYEGIREFYSPEKLAYARLRLLADYFEMLDLQHHKILCIKILIKFASFCELGSKKELESIVCLAHMEICFSYLKLRLTKEAEFFLHQAQDIMKTKNCHEVIEAYYLATYAYYLACLGHLSKAKQYLAVAVKRASELATDTDSSCTLNMEIYSGKHLMSYVSLCSAIILLLLGDVVSAVHSAEVSLELLVKAFIHTLPDIYSLFISITNPKTLPSQGSSGSARPPSGSVVSLSKMGSSLAELNKWNFASKLMNVYNILGTMYMYRGSSHEANYYYGQGLEVAQLNNSWVLQSHFLISIAELDSRRSLYDKSGEKLEESQKKLKQMFNPSEIPLTHLVYLKFCSGNYKLRSNDIVAALELYRETESYVRKCTTKTDEAFLEIVLPKVSSSMKGFLPDKERIDIRGVNENDLVSDKNEAEFYLFQCMMVEIAARIGTALTRQQRILDAEAALISAESLRLRQIEQSEYYAALTRLKMFKIVQQLKEDMNHSAVFDTVFSLPLLCSAPESEILQLSVPIQKKVKRRAKSISTLCNFLKKAFHLAYLYGPSTQIHEIAHSISYLCVIQGYLPGYASLSSTAELAALSSLYLEISKGYTAKREYLSIVRERVHAIKEINVKGDSIPSCAFSRKLRHTSASPEWYISEKISKYYELEDATDQSVYDVIQKLLPSNWTAFSISVDMERTDLYVSRYSRNERLVLRLPLNRQSLRGDTKQEFPDLESVSSVLGQLLKENREIMGYAGSCTTSELKADWWRKRMVVNDKLRNLIDTIEGEWFGAFRNIFSLNLIPCIELEMDIEHFKSKLIDTIEMYIGDKCLESGDDISQGYINSSLCKLILSLGPEASYSDLEDVIYFILNSYHYTGLRIDYSQLSLESMADGILNIIREFYNQSSKLPIPHLSSHVLLILDRNLQFFPWENLPSLRDLPSCRLPTLSFLRDHLLKLEESGEIEYSDRGCYNSVDSSNCYYLLNPGKDLPSTQKTFEKYLQSQKLWSGIVGYAPEEADIIDNLEKNDIFIYFGHGGGERYINGQNIRKLSCGPVALLLGCSSGVLQQQGEFDPSGTPLNYLMSGRSRAILANLWDVTDGDIDRFSTETFKEWKLGNTNLIEKQPGNIRNPKSHLYPKDACISLSEAVMRSRNSCVLSYLTGAAPVVYGIPVYLKR